VARWQSRKMPGTVLVPMVSAADNNDHLTMSPIHEPLQDAGAVWLGSGSVVKTLSGEYVMNFSQEGYDCDFGNTTTTADDQSSTSNITDKFCQSIFFATSKDLLTWHRVPFAPPPADDPNVFKYVQLQYALHVCRVRVPLICRVCVFHYCNTYSVCCHVHVCRMHCQQACPMCAVSESARLRSVGVRGPLDRASSSRWRLWSHHRPSTFPPPWYVRVYVHNDVVCRQCQGTARGTKWGVGGTASRRSPSQARLGCSTATGQPRPTEDAVQALAKPPTSTARRGACCRPSPKAFRRCVFLPV
jgi:hypothetical protein